MSRVVINHYRLARFVTEGVVGNEHIETVIQRHKAAGAERVELRLSRRQILGARRWQSEATRVKA